MRSFTAVIAALLGCRPAGPPQSDVPTSNVPIADVATTDAEELRAFAKLYGYVRFFHPSDAAAEADWDRIAIEGARAAMQGTTQAELLASLRATFEPLSPTLVLWRDGETPPKAEPMKNGDVLAWQHEGYGLGQLASVYFSGRTGRPRSAWTEGDPWTSFSRSIPAEDVRGKRVRLRGWARTDGTKRDLKGQFFLRVDGVQRASEFFDNMQDRPIVSRAWQEATIAAPAIGPRAKKVAFGGMANGSGSVLFDDLVLETAPPSSETWTPVALDNADFEGDPITRGWKAESPNHSFAASSEAHGGRAALKITRTVATFMTDMFPERPKVGETFERSLGAGLSCRVVLGLPLTPYREGAAAVQQPLPDASDPAVRAAAVVVAWNVLRHFYPYHDVIGEDWNAVLDLAIADVLDDRNPEDTTLTLRRLVHRLHDGHGHVDGAGGDTSAMVRIALVDGIYIVVAAAKDGPLRWGDELVAVDGVAIAEMHERRKELYSGSPQWIDHVLLEWGWITAGTSNIATIDIRRDGAAQRFEIARTAGMPPPEHERKSIEKLRGGIFYVDLDRATDDELKAKLAAIAKAPGVVFDLRGYPKSTPWWLANLMTKRDDAKWMFVPHVIRPDYEGVTTFTAHGWDVEPAEPHIAGKVAFITGPGAISYAESVMGYVEGYQLGAIVGSPTAGANGNVNPIVVPGGYGITFTGLKVTRIDGRQHHLLGVKPTHPVKRTLAGIRAHRDEELEAALALVR